MILSHPVLGGYLILIITASLDYFHSNISESMNIIMSSSYFTNIKETGVFHEKTQQVYSSFFFPPIFLRTTVIHSKNCPDNFRSLFLSLIFVLHA